MSKQIQYGFKKGEKDVLLATMSLADTGQLGLVAPTDKIAFLFDAEKASAAAIANARKLCSDKGFNNVFVDPDVLSQSGDTKVYKNKWALNPADRARHFIKLIEDPEIKVIWPFNGSGGASDMYERVNDILHNPEFGKERRERFFAACQNKVIVGAFSHQTDLALFGAANQFKAVINATQIGHLAEFYSNDKLRAKLSNNIDAPFHALLSGQTITHELTPYNDKAKQHRNLEGRVVGGNIGVLSANLNSLWGPKFKGNFLLLEDIFATHDHAYDRMIVPIIKTAVSQGVRAIILGPIRGTADQQKAIENVIKSRLEDLAPGLPVFRTDTIGHLSTNLPLDFGYKAVIRGGKLISGFGHDLAAGKTLDSSVTTLPVGKWSEQHSAKVSKLGWVDQERIREDHNQLRARL